VGPSGSAPPLVDVHRAFEAEEHAEGLAGALGADAGGLELGLGDAELLGGAHLVDAAAEAAGEAGVGEVAVRERGVAGAGERVEVAPLRERGEPGARGGGGDLPAGLDRAGAGGVDVVARVRPLRPALRHHQRDREREVGRELVGARDDAPLEHAVGVEAGVDRVARERRERGRAGLLDEGLGAAHLGLRDGGRGVAGQRAGDRGAEGEAERGGVVGGRGLREGDRGREEREGGREERCGPGLHRRGGGYRAGPLRSQWLRLQ
jgi:hypothetical protein